MQAPRPASVDGAETTFAAGRDAAIKRLRALAPGVCLAGSIALAATVTGASIPVVGAPVIAIVLGIAIAAAAKPTVRFRPGIAFTSKRVLQASIVVFGFGLSLTEVASTSAGSLPVLIGTLLAALAMSWFAGRLLHLGSDLRILIGVGTAICGASAIAATDAVINADEADVSYAITTIFTFNVIAVLLYPAIGHALRLSPSAFGLWAGTAINDLSSVVAASTVYGHMAASVGVIVKLTRTLAIIPITFGIAVGRGSRAAKAGDAPAQRRRNRGRTLPLFLVAFVAAVLLNTVGAIPSAGHHVLSTLSLVMITAALAAIGLSTDVGYLRRAGFRPLALGAILWVTVGLASLGLQALTGRL